MMALTTLKEMDPPVHFKYNEFAKGQGGKYNFTLFLA